MENLVRECIKFITQEIIDEYGIDIPVTDIDDIVARMGGTVEEKAGLNGMRDGTIIRVGAEGFRIAAASDQSPHRRTFAVAHELGHLFLHMGFRTNVELWNRQSTSEYMRFGYSDQEYQANEFAAALLMPEALYWQAVQDSLADGRVNINNVAEFFNVSVVTAANRGRFLGYFI